MMTDTLLPSMITVIVTGALGGIGSWVTDYFAEQNNEVVAVDRWRPSKSRSNVHFRAADLTEQGPAWDLILETNPDAVLHFAGVRSGRMPRKKLFDANVQSTYNVLTAAGEVGADVVWASSERAYGFPYDRPVMPEYLPIDEEHPCHPVSSYGTAKALGEGIAGMVARRYSVKIASMRATWVRFPNKYDMNTLDPTDVTPDEPTSTNFWGYVDIRDVISFIEAVLESDIDGHEAFNVSAHNNHAGASTTELLKRALGDLPELCDIEGEESVYSIEKAKDMIGWEPDHDWRTSVKEDDDIDAPSFTN